ncbi:MAG: hypothetical protein QM597_09410 [Aeromicrobium sp.]|uniref:variant leucine-rich repeat-containing protein n=1 Tax=Aeromicrobium sp. TaxID=1871063 RepID=UPI0039E65AAE
MATDETRAEASNPATAPARLQELTSDPELWPLIAAHPNAYPGLLTWLGENGGNDVKAAIAGRGNGAAAAEPTAVLPPAAPPTPAAPMTPPPGAAFPPPGGALPPPGGAAVPPAGFPAPGAPQGGSGGSKKGLWITLGIVAFLLIGSGVGVGVWALTKDDDSQQASTDGEDKKSSNDDDDEKKSDDDDDEKDSDELDCDGLEDVADAADDLNMYIPDLDEESVLTDAVETIEEFEDYDNEEVAEWVDIFLSFADAIEEDPDAIWGDEYLESSQAASDLESFLADEC